MEADPASIGIAKSPVPIIPITNKIKAKYQQNGFNAKAASATVAIFVIPFPNKPLHWSQL